jgi:hypothetical protein
VVKPARLLLAVALVAALLTIAFPGGEAAADHCSRLLTTLSGPAIVGVVPSGRGEWRGNDLCNLGLELRVEIANVNRPDGTVVTLATCVDPATGRLFQRDLTLSRGAASLELRRSDGEDVPRCDRDSPVRVLQAGATILSGVWCAPTVRRCP